MKSLKPYILRAFYEWIVDCGHTPHLLVDSTAEGVQVPKEYAREDGQIVINIAPQAVSQCVIDDEGVRCGARFAGRLSELVLPTESVRSIYSRESGAGVMLGEGGPFGAGDSQPPPPRPRPGSSGPPSGSSRDDGIRRGPLRVVK